MLASVRLRSLGEEKGGLLIMRLLPGCRACILVLPITLVLCTSPCCFMLHVYLYIEPGIVFFLLCNGCFFSTLKASDFGIDLLGSCPP